MSEQALTAEEWRRWQRKPDWADTGISQSERQYIAAIALHEQSFGFDHDDVNALREAIDQLVSCSRSIMWDRSLGSLANRIEALLPPGES